MPESDAESGENIGRDDLDECWCCGGLHDSPKALCPDCDEAGCQHFGAGCESDHKPVLSDGGNVRESSGIERLPEPTYTGRCVDLDYCQRCGVAFSTQYSGWFIDTVDVEGTGDNARLFREDAENFGEWQGFEEEDEGPWCENCSWVLQRKRTRNTHSLHTDTQQENQS